MQGSNALGIRENIVSFTLLVIINLFVGSMVGLERTILPILGEREFGIASTSAALSFIVTFGFSKALINLYAGKLSDTFGRKRILLIGWTAGILVPLVVIYATAWWMIVLANVLLGINQGLCWSMTVNMKIDLAKPKQRATAIGWNEFAGYAGVALTSMLTGYLAVTYSLRPEPFIVGVIFAGMGLLLSFAAKSDRMEPPMTGSQNIGMREAFLRTSWTNRSLFSCSLAGMATNFKDGMAWGLFPLFFSAKGLSTFEIGLLIALYPGAWGLFQIFVGYASDRVGRKSFIISGLILQSTAIYLIVLSQTFVFWAFASILLGLGTALVYPTLQAAITDAAAPSWRATSMGVFRFWRDSGYALGALSAGFLVDHFSVLFAIAGIALFPLLGAVVVKMNMNEAKSDPS